MAEPTIEIAPVIVAPVAPSEDVVSDTPSERLAQDQIDAANVEEGHAAALHEVDHQQLHQENEKSWQAITNMTQRLEVGLEGIHQLLRQHLEQLQSTPESTPESTATVVAIDPEPTVESASGEEGDPETTPQIVPTRGQIW